MTGLRRLRYAAAVAALAGVYYAAARFGLSLDAVSGFATLVWPPTGIALASLLTFGARLWPGIATGAFLANLAAGAPWPAALGIGIGNTLEALVGTWLLRRAAFRSSMERFRDVAALLVGAATLSTAVSATVGVTSLCLAGIVSGPRFALTWLAWWLGDVMGDLVVAPLLLVWAAGPRPRLQTRRTAEAALLGATLVLAGLSLFAGTHDPGWVQVVRPYFIYPVLIWAALRFGPCGGVTATFVVSAISIWGAAQGASPFRGESLSGSLMALQVFMGLAAVTVLILGAAAAERRQALTSLQHARDELELRVEERTARLREANQKLMEEIIERQHAEVRLLASEEKFRSVVETANDAVVSADAEGLVTFFNRGAERTFGYAAAEIIGKPLTVLMPDRFHDAHQRGLQRFLSTGDARVIGRTVELAGKRKEGTEFPLELSLASWKTSAGTFFTAILRDIAERKQAEEALRAGRQALEALNLSLEKRVSERTAELSDVVVRLEREARERQRVEERFRMVVEGAPNGIVMVDGDGKIVLVNAQAEKMFGYAREELVGRPIETLVPRRSRDPHVAHRVEFTAVPQARPMGAGRDLYGVRKDGTEVPVEIGLSPLVTPEGTFVMASVVDVTERKRIEADIKHHAERLARSNAELEQFAYVASHDLQEPLRMVTSYMELLQRRYGDKLDATAQRFIGHATDGARRLHQMIRDLLAYARMDRGTGVHLPVDCGEALDGALANLKRLIEESGAEVRRGTLPRVLGHRALLTALFQNLVDNAVKYRSDAPPIVEVSAERRGDEWTLAVRDNGIGIDPQYHDRIFRLFQRLHPRDQYAGTGIGLATARKIVERHGGRIWVESGSGQGAAFHFTLPAAPEGGPRS